MDTVEGKHALVLIKFLQSILIVVSCILLSTYQVYLNLNLYIAYKVATHKKSLVNVGEKN